jgi:O-antigen/teichoic acid export membrane protein
LKKPQTKIFRLVFAACGYAGFEVVARLAQFGVLFYLARSIAKSEYGQLGFFFSLQQVIMLFALGGLTEAVTGVFNTYRTNNQLPILSHNLKFLMLRISLAIAAVYLAVLFLFVKSILTASTLITYLAVLTSGILLARINMKAMLFQLGENHRHSIMIKTAPLILGYLMGFMSVLYISENRSMWFFVFVAIGFGSAFFFGKMVRSSNDVPSGIVDHQLIKTLMKAAAPFLITGLLSWLSGYGNTVFVKYFFPNEAVAEFTMVCNFNFILFLLINSINQVWAPHFFKIAIKISENHLSDLNSFVNQIQVIAISLISGIILLYFPFLIKTVGGNFIYYTSIHPFLLITFSAYIVLNMYYRSSPYYLLHREGGLFLRIILLTSLVGTTTWLLLMKNIGTWGIYIGFYVVHFLRSVSLFWCSRKWRVRMSWMDLVLPQAILGAGYFFSLNTPNIVVATLSFGLFVSALIFVFLFFIRDRFKENIRILVMEWDPAEIGLCTPDGGLKSHDVARIKKIT